MNTLTLEYKTPSQLEQFIDINNILLSSDKLLIQVFTSQNNQEFILELRSNILNKLPSAKIIGSTTCGEISNNGAIYDATVISFMIFDNTIIKTNLVEYNISSYAMGQDILTSFDDYIGEDLKLLISFTDGLNTNGEEYLDGISELNDDIIVAGGMAGDNTKFEETIVFTESNITNKGAVAAAFYNKDLNIYTDYSFNWETVGKKHIVEKSNKNRVYKISGMTTVDFYKHYLGHDIDKLLPSIGIEFPLVIKKDNINIARAVLTKHDDGSLSFAGNISEGSVVQFGHGDVQMIINKGLENVKNFIDNPVESIFIYSCMARKSLLKEDINLEILPLKEIAPISGFFTYGEFYHNCEDEHCGSKLLNQTMTIVGISENTTMINEISPNIFSSNPAQNHEQTLHRTQALSVLIAQTTKELVSLNQDLEKKVKKEIEKNVKKDALLQVKQTQAQLGDMIEMILHQWRQPLSAIVSTISSIQFYKESDILDDDILDDSLKNVLSYSDHLNTTIEDFRDLFKVNHDSSNILLSACINKALTIIEPLIKKEEIAIIKDFNQDIEVSIPIGLMMQVILNIVRNAIDILIEKKIENPHIKFKIKISDDNCIIQISDNGGGIPENILPYIFDKNFTTKGDDEGTGIGLDMSKLIIESRMGGKLTANNEENWAVFSIEIPIL